MQKIVLIPLIIGFTSVFSINQPLYTETVENGQKSGKIAQPEAIILPIELKRICSCESTGNPNNEPVQFESDNVTVLRGRVNSRDIGACQINLDYHEAKAKELNLDLFVENDNKKYAKYLYENEGTTPWNWSKSCWGK